VPTRTTAPTPRNAPGKKGRRFGAAAFGLLLVATAVVFWVSTEYASKVTPENYDHLHTGMTIDEVTAVLGEPAGERKATPGPHVRTLGWKHGDDMVVVTFEHGKLVSRSATFRPGEQRTAATISTATFGKLRSGMSFDEVKQVLGAPAREETGALALSNTRFRMVYWERGFDNVSLRFSDDRLQGGIAALDGKMLAVGPGQRR
jgi:hypothetical protein